MKSRLRGSADSGLLVPVVLCWLAVLFLVGSLSLARIQRNTKAPSLDYPAPAYRLLAQYDSAWYLRIAEEGYQRTHSTNFFPLFPFLIRMMGPLVGNNFFLAGIILDWIALAAGLLLFYRLARLDLEREAAQRSVLCLLAWPTAFILACIMTESLFLALVLGAFLAARRERWILSALLGGLAAATRTVGVLLIVPLAWEYLAAHGRLPIGGGEVAAKPRPLDRQGLALVLVPAGMAAYMAYLWRAKGDPLDFLHSAAVWSRGVGWGALTHIYSEVAPLFHNPHFSSSLAAIRIMELAAGLLFLALLIPTIRAFRFSYGLYAAAMVLAPLLTGTLLGMNRYVLVVFPVFLLLGKWGREPWVERIILMLGLPLLGLHYALYVNGWWVE